jgi:hypothetical protein
MSEKLNFISNEISKHRSNIENERNNTIEANKARIEKEKQLLYDSGVISLMQEIVDAGLVKWSDKPVTKKEKLFFGGEKDVVVSNYTPAKIFLSNPDPNPSSFSKKEVFVSLEFNYEYDYDSTDNCDAVKISVTDNELYLVSPCQHTQKHYDGDYTLIKEDEIAESIVKGIKYPIHRNISSSNNKDYLYTVNKTP